MKNLVYAIIVFVFVSCSNVTNEDSIRDTSQGLMIGTNYDNKTFAWKGIPFAKAPIGCLLYTSPSPRD